MVRIWSSDCIYITYKSLESDFLLTKNYNFGIIFVGKRKELPMAVSYIKLWKLLLDKGMKKTDLIDNAGISSNVLARLGKNNFVAMESLEKICKSLECNIGDIVEFYFDNNGGGENGL